jgi:hypothetical protein
MAWDAAGPKNQGMVDKPPVFGKGDTSMLPTFKLKRKQDAGESETSQQAAP